MYRTKRFTKNVVFILTVFVLIASDIAFAEFVEAPPAYVRQWIVSSPSGPGFDFLGNIFVIDRSHKLLKKSDYLGMSITEWASCGLSNFSQCTVPYDIALDSSDNMYVIDTNGIAKFDHDGKFIKRFRIKVSFGSGIAVNSSVDSFGNPFIDVYVTNSQSHSVQKFSSEGTLVTQWGRFGTAIGQFRYPYDVAVDSEGNVYVADSYNQRIQKFVLIAWVGVSIGLQWIFGVIIPYLAVVLFVIGFVRKSSRVVAFGRAFRDSYHRRPGEILRLDPGLQARQPFEQTRSFHAFGP